MDETTTQAVLLIRAVEEHDAEGKVLSAASRTEATRAAIDGTSGGEDAGALPADRAARVAAIGRRAVGLRDELLRKLPTLRGLLQTMRLRIGAGPIVAVVALLSGLSTNVFGTREQVNLLSFPLLAMLAWNLAIYVATAGLAITRRDSPDRSRLPTGLVERVVGSILRRASAKAGRRAREASTLAPALARFAGDWHRSAGALLTLRAKRWFHVGAVAFAAGVIGGMYVRGLAFEYLATWQSTFLDASGVQSLLNAVLGPAASLLGTQVPDVAPLQGPPGENAAKWIHLFAAATALYVLVPRTVLALLQGWQARRLAARLPLDLDDGYMRRVFSQWRGATRHAVVVPYSFVPEVETIDRLKAALHDLLGARADIRVHAPLEYGDDAERVTDAADGPHTEDADLWVVVVFNLAQSPEVEVHGEFLDKLRQHQESDRRRILAVVDPSSYAHVDAQRRDERARAWRRVVRETGSDLVVLDRQRSDRPGWSEAFAQVLGTGGESSPEIPS